MDAIREDVEKLTMIELESANEKFPQFHSLHEAYGVMLEEMIELEEAATRAKSMINVFMTYSVRKDKKGEGSKCTIGHLRRYAINAAVESIQLAAMAQKTLDFLEREGDE